MKHDPPRQLLAAGGQLAGDFEQRGRARGVVVGAVVNFVRAGSGRAVAAEAQMVVMGADDDRFVGVRAVAFEHGDHVFDFGLASARRVVWPTSRQPASSRLCGVGPLSISRSRRAQVRAERGLNNRLDRAAAAKQHAEIARFAFEPAPSKAEQRIFGP